MKKSLTNILAILVLNSFLIACNNNSASYTVEEEKVIKDNRTITEESAVEMLLVSDSNVEENISKIDAYKIPTFNWKKFWKLAYQDRVLENKSQENILRVLTLNEGICKSYQVNAFTQYLLKETQRVDEIQKIILLNKYNSYTSQCNLLPSEDISNQNLHENIKLMSQSTKKNEAVELFSNTLALYKRNMTTDQFSKLIQKVSISDMTNASQSIQRSGNAQSIYSLSNSLNSINNTNIKTIVRRLLIAVIDNDENLDTIINAYGLKDTINIIENFGEQFYGAVQRRNLTKDIESLAKATITSELNLEKTEYLEQWRIIQTLKDIINKYSTNEDFKPAMISFNKVIKNFEKISLNTTGTDIILADLSQTSILAKWVEIRVLNFKTKKHTPHLTDLRAYVENSKIESVFKKRMELYTAKNEDIAIIKKKEYCQTLNDLGVKSQSMSLSKIQTSITKLSGCITYSAPSPTELQISLPKIILDDDLLLTLNDVSLKLRSNEIDINFVDLSSKLEREIIPQEDTPYEYNSIAFPILYGIKINGAYRYFHYHYVLRDPKAGPAYSPWKPKQGYPGGNLFMQNKILNKNFYPLLISKGGQGQVAEAPIAGGKGVELEMVPEDFIGDNNVENNLIPADEEGVEELYNFLRSTPLEDVDYIVTDYLIDMKDAIKGNPDLKEIHGTIVEQLKLASKFKQTCIQNYDTNCIIEKVAHDALRALKSRLVLMEDDFELENLENYFYIEDMDDGPMPAQGKLGESGRLYHL